MEENLILIFRLGLVTVILWIASRVFELIRDHWDNTRKQRSFLRALFAEIDFNTSDMANFLQKSADMAVLERKLKRKEFLPHITDARHVIIYRENLGKLMKLDDKFISEAVRLYGDLEKIKSLIDGIYQPSFQTISAKGRLNIVKNIFATAERCHENGIGLLGALQKQYPHLQLTRRLMA